MGGTFDPIHNGHLVAAEEARYQFKLDKVIFMPSGRPPHKKASEVLPGEERYLMTVIATSSNPFFFVSRLEIERSGPSYTVDTVRQLHKEYGHSKIYFISGADAVWEILTWKDPDKLAEYCTFIAATRPGYDLTKFKSLHASKQNSSALKMPEVKIMEVPALAISSTDIRKRISQGQPIRYLLPEPVANYIEKRGFYLGRNDK
jgi:nicotinate-nucleotide adenylyltransferase